MTADPYGAGQSGGNVLAGVSDPKAKAISEAARGDRLFRGGQMAAALDCYLLAAQLQPGDATYHYNAACTARLLGRGDIAQRHFLQAVVLAPAHAFAHVGLAQLLLEQRDVSGALEHTERALKAAPDHPEVAGAYASALYAAGRHEEAAALICQRLEAGQRAPVLALVYARLAPKLGQEGQALSVIENLLASGAMSVGTRSMLHYAASVILDSIGRYDEAFAHATAAHGPFRGAYDPDRHSRSVDELIRYFTASKLRELPRASQRSSLPVFVVGMPRSGTSLVEQMLASHPAVHGAGELDLMGRVSGSLPRVLATSQPPPCCLDSLSVPAANELANIYLAPLRRLAPDAARIIDKLPFNFMTLGLIAVLLPEAHVIHCQRDPLDTCVSCFMTNFEHHIGFSHELSHLGAFYRDYRRLVDHFRSVLDRPILDVRYESLVDDTETEVRQMLGFLGLKWDERCLRFHENQRYVGTPSAEQVRRPIYRSSIGRWRNYQQHLSQLVDAMQVVET